MYVTITIRGKEAMNLRVGENVERLEGGHLGGAGERKRRRERNAILFHFLFLFQ